MSLADELRQTADSLRSTIAAATEQARRQGIDPHAMVTPDGAPVLAPMLAALAQCLAALAYLGARPPAEKPNP